MKGDSVTEKDAMFLLAKVNVIEHLCTNQIALLAKLTESMTRGMPTAEEYIDTMEHNVRGLVQHHVRVLEGDIQRTDPLALQTEMLRQLGPVFHHIRRALDTYSGREPRE
jgi:hypothetical protein